MYTYTVRRRRFVFEGNEIMRVSASVPLAESFETISDFYSEISNNFIKWCEDSAFPALCEEYNSLSQQKYIYRKISYSLDCEVTYISEHTLCVLSRARSSLFRGETRTLFEEYQVWSLPEGELLPSKYAAKLICGELETDIPPFPRGAVSVGTDGKSLLFMPYSN